MARADSTLDAQGTTGNPYFDCVGMNSGAVPFKSFVQANGNNAKTLANHFVSYLKGGLSTKVPTFFTVHALSPLSAHPVGTQSAPFCPSMHG